MKLFIQPICIFVLIAVVSSVSPTNAADETLNIASGGKTDYVIVTPAEPAPPVQTASKELQKHLAKVTGATLEILPENKAPADAKQILVGYGQRAKKL